MKLAQLNGEKLKKKPQLFVDRFHFDIIQRQKQFLLDALFFHVLNTFVRRFMRIDNNCIHIFAQNFRHRQLVPFMSRLT